MTPLSARPETGSGSPTGPGADPPADSGAGSGTATGASGARRPIAAVALCGLVLAMSGPGQTAGMSVLIDHFIRDLDVSRSAVSTAYMIGTLCGAAALPWIGRAVDRFGVRPVLAAVALVFGCFLTLLSLVEGIVGLTVAFVGARALGQGGMTLVATTAVAIAVTRKRGTAIGATTALGTAGISLVPVATERIIAELGWRAAVFGEALAVWVIVLPIAVWGLRGARASDGGTGAQDADGGGAAETAWPLRAIMRTSMFWIITGAVACSGLVTTAVFFHQVSVLGEQGLTPAQAAANFLPQTAAGLLASFGFSAATDRFSPKLLIMGCMAMQTAALCMLPVVGPGLTAVTYGMALGAGAAGARSVEAAAFPYYYGTASLGTLRGLTQSVAVSSTAVAPLLLSLGRDLAGSYLPPVLALAVLPALIAVAAPFARRPRRRQGASADDPGGSAAEEG
ncbi:MFS transporter [Streptomonospora salina]|uniref:MFS family permease n=1 Tax=Streptomonospora salina TaxID=104205 RepID=A0A841E7T0_9ACTN|nr:MFS transporter [Streptomonospora salina]MBB5997359.1 MFS family permease [Streptomonospora salina]